MTNIPPLYLIEVDYGRSGRSFVEFDRDTNSRASIIKDIADGQYDRGEIVTILEIFEDEGTCRNITEDIANEVTQEIYRRGAEWPVHIEGFLKVKSKMEAAE